MKLLLIDDEENLVELFQSILIRKGYSVDIATNINTAEKLANDNTYDFILIDYYIGPKNSLEFIVKLLEKYNEKQLCICSGTERKKDYEKLRKIGITKTLKKPITYNEILEKIS